MTPAFVLKLEALRSRLDETVSATTQKKWWENNDDEIYAIIELGEDADAKELARILTRRGWTVLKATGHLSLVALSPEGDEVEWRGRLADEDEAASGQDWIHWYPQLTREKAREP